MSIDIDFTGSESPAEIAKAAIEIFAKGPMPDKCDVSFSTKPPFPKMRYAFTGATAEFECVFRLDIITPSKILSASDGTRRALVAQLCGTDQIFPTKPPTHPTTVAENVATTGLEGVILSSKRVGLGLSLLLCITQ